jgi:hypothetical protein
MKSWRLPWQSAAKVRAIGTALLIGAIFVGRKAKQSARLIERAKIFACAGQFVLKELHT